MSTREERERLQSEYSSLIDQRSAIQERLTTQDTPALRSMLARTESSILRIDQELSRTQNTPGASTEAERDAINSEREEARTEASQLIESLAERLAEETGTTREEFFEEHEVQTYYHDLMVYIQGADVTRHVQGSVSVTLGTNDTTNTLSLTLNNTGDLFTITPENIAGIWRLGPDQPYSENEKKAIYDIKNDINRNPFDVGTGDSPGSGSRRWNLAVYGCVFHRMDPVRVWAHNPNSDSDVDEWIPVFTGYLTTKGIQDGWINGESSIQIQATDIRDLMRHMRVDRNSLLYETPGGRNLSGSATPAGAAPAQGVNAATRVRRQERPQDLTFTAARADRDLAIATGQAAPRRNASALEDTIERCNELLQRAANTLGISRSLRFFSDLIRNAADNPMSWAHCSYLQITHALTLGSDHPPIIRNARGDRSPGQNLAARGGIGRMREGLAYYYPDPDTNLNRDAHATDNLGSSERVESFEQDTVKNQALLSRWYKLCLFGSPQRHGCTANPGERLAPKVGLNDFRFWTRAEVEAAGSRTITDDIWAPDMQLVHWLIPSQGANARSDGLIEVGIGPDQVAGERNFTTRYDLMMDMTKMVDYRVSVSGAGDIIFSFPMYDFYPDDYGSEWAPVMKFDHHLVDSTIDDEHSDVPTVFIAVGRMVPVLASTGSSGFAQRFAPGLIPSKTMWSPMLASRFGIKIEIEDFPWIDSPDKLKSIAVVRYQKYLMEADSFACTAASRLMMLPNAPFHMIPRERISLTASVTHTWEIFGEVQTQFDLHGSRYMDIYGIRRNITGGRSLPLSFSAIPGRGDYNTVPFQRVLTGRVDTLRAQGFTPDEIVYGQFEGGNIVYQDGRNNTPARPVSRTQREMIQNVRTALNRVDSLASYRFVQVPFAGIPPAVSGAEVLRRATDMQAIPAGHAALNVVPGFQNVRMGDDAEQLELDYTNLFDAQQTANEAATAVRRVLSAADNQNSRNVAFGSTGIRSVEEIVQQEDSDVITERILNGQPGSSGPTRDQTSAFALQREPARLNIFTCEDCPTIVGFWRDMRAACERILPSLSARARDVLICLSAIETKSGFKMHNNNAGNITARVNLWAGKWHVWAGVQYRSYDTLEEGILNLYNYVEVRVPGSHTILQTGELRFIQHLYSHSYGSAVMGTPEGTQSGLSKMRTAADVLSLAQRLDRDGTIARAPACDPDEQANRTRERMDEINRLNASAAGAHRTTVRRSTPARAGTAAVPPPAGTPGAGTPGAPGVPATPGSPAIPPVFDPASVLIPRST